MRKQMFMDGNKRTAMLAANQIMISSGSGILSIPVEKQRLFRELLIHFYQTGDMEAIRSFIYSECIDGMDFAPLEAQMDAQKTARIAEEGM